MSGLLVLVHTMAPLIDVFNRECERQLPGVQRMHILDEPLLAAITAGRSTPTQTRERLLGHIQQAQACGAKMVLVTCSTVSPFVDTIRSEVNIPVVKIDEEMIARAIQTGERIGVVATNPATLEPTRQSLQAEATRQRRPVIVEMRLAADAFVAIQRGDTALHDRLVWNEIMGLDGKVDVILLAQASMARVLETDPLPVSVPPIFTSPRLAVERLARTDIK